MKMKQRTFTKTNKEIRRCTFRFGKIGRAITIWVAIKKSNIANAMLKKKIYK